MAKRKPRKKISLPGGASAPNPLRGRDRRHEPTDAAAITARDARIRVFGLGGRKAETMPLLGPLCGSHVGLCILDVIPGPDQASAWQAWQDLSSARRNYRQRIIGTTGDPQCAALAMIPDAMQTDQSLTIDLRTSDERDASARRAWSMWEGRIKDLPSPQMIWAIRAALDDGINPDAYKFWDKGKPTHAGRALIAGLLQLAG